MLTLEERERLAWVTNHPAAKLLASALQVENDEIDEMRHEVDMTKQTNGELQQKLEDSEAAVEAWATDAEMLRQERDALRAQALGLDRVSRELFYA